MPDFLARLKAMHEAATPGPWGPDIYRLAGEMPALFGKGKCSYCQNDEPMVRGRFNINGKTMPAHIHRGEDWSKGRELVHFDGTHAPTAVAGIYDHEAGGIVNPEDADLIVLLRNHAPELIAVLEAARALDKAWGEAIDAMDDDNVVETTAWVRWERASTAHHRALAALEAEAKG